MCSLPIYIPSVSLKMISFPCAVADAMDSLLPEERELAMKVFGEEMSLADYADMKKQNPRTLSDHKRRILSKLRRFFSERGFEVDSR